MIFAILMGFSWVSYELTHITAPGINRSAVFDDGKIGCQTVQKRLPWGVRSCEVRKENPRSIRESSEILTKQSIFMKTASFTG